MHMNQHKNATSLYGISLDGVLEHKSKTLVSENMDWLNFYWNCVIIISLYIYEK